MKKQERKQEENRIREKLFKLFKGSIKSVFFCYHYKSKAMLITYEDFKPESRLQEKVEQAVGTGWYVTLKREYSDARIMLAILDVFRQNKVLICYSQDGEVKSDTVRGYVYHCLADR